MAIYKIQNAFFGVPLLCIHQCAIEMLIDIWTLQMASGWISQEKTPIKSQDRFPMPLPRKAGE